MSQSIKKVVIVGGGTAGWLAASHLGKSLNAANNPDIDITLVESDKIAPIGVGEGTVPAMRGTLKYFGISETEFFRRCDATFKQSIKFDGWLGNKTQNEEDSYHHIFDIASQSPTETSVYWQLASQQTKTRYTDSVSIQASLCDAMLAPKTITTPEFQGQASYAYHLDAHKFSDLLKENAIGKLGIKHLIDNVSEVSLAEDGDIAAVIGDRSGHIEADLFVDCSGFQSLLLGKALEVPFVDKSDILFVDHALTIQVPYDNDNTDIPPYTIATAQENGWTWDISLPQRRGIGYVYSSKYTSHERAREVLSEYLKGEHADIEPRLIPMKIGYRQEFWHKNCVAIGLSAGFVEPLEATGLLAFDSSSRNLAENFPATRQHMDIVAKDYNHKIQYVWDRVIDFVKLHYFLSGRRDTQFWIDNTNPNSAPEGLLNKLEHWRHSPPTESDFFSRYEMFNLDNYLYILNGMNFETDPAIYANRFGDQEHANKKSAAIHKRARQAVNELPKQRELIEKIKKYGLQTV